LMTELLVGKAVMRVAPVVARNIQHAVVCGIMQHRCTPLLVTQSRGDVDHDNRLRASDTGPEAALCLPQIDDVIDTQGMS
jgi:hypothetical protein